MPSQSIVDRLAAWWRRPVVRKTHYEACIEDPDGALAAIQEEQGIIAQELEELFLTYDRQLRAIAERLADGDHPPSKKDLERLRQEQIELWRLVRRAQVAGRSTDALAQELQEWRGRESRVTVQGHPDHPLTRAEIVASELRVRGVDAAPIDQQDVIVAASDARLVPTESDEWVLREITNRERELRKLIAAAEEDPSVLPEITLQNRELRSLHATLRQIDRQNGVTRERWKMNVTA